MNTKDCSLVEERSVEITVEVDATNNGAHGVKAYENFPIVSHSEKKNTRDKLKRSYKSISVITQEDLEQNFGSSREDVANSFGTEIEAHLQATWDPSVAISERKKKGEKDVSPTCSKMPTDEQTERGNEMVRHLQDQNEGPNLPNTENGSNKESITTLIFQDSVPEGEKNVPPTYKTPTVGIVLDFKEGPNLSNIENHSNEESITASTFQDSVPVFERDCILLEPQGEKNASPTHSTPTNGETKVGNGMVGHIQDQNGIMPEFIESPNLSNIENCSNEKSLTIPNFQDSGVPLNWQSNELTPSMAYPNPNACVFTQPHISLREMPIENVGSSRDSRNFSSSAVGFFMGGHVSESSWTMPLCSNLAPMQTMATIPHTMPHLTEKQDITIVTFKARYGDNTRRFCLSLPSGIVELKKEVTNRLGELGSFKVNYQDNDNEWILIGCDTDVWDCFKLSSSSRDAVVRLWVRD
ncbi:unnamed protein product [Camellia sinensis]